MSVHHLSRVPRPQLRDAAAVQGSLALSERSARLPGPATAPAPLHTDGGAPAHVRALPVAVPRRRRPAHPTRRRSSSTAAPASPAPSPLWDDVRPWGVEQSAAIESPVSTAGRVTAQPIAASESAAPMQARPVRARPVRVPARRTEAAPGGARAGRGVALLAITALAVGALGIGVGSALAVGATPAPAVVDQAAATEVTRVAVEPGQTLWQIAERHTPAGQDVRETVAMIADANGLSQGQLQAGQVLEVPAH